MLTQFVFLSFVVSVTNADPYQCSSPYVPGKHVGSLRVPSTCRLKDLGCPRSWKQGIPEGLAKAKPLIDYKFINCHEEFTTCGYVPIDQDSGSVLGNSGVTVGAGIDLGSKSRSFKGFASLSTFLVNKLEPYFRLTKNDAACAAIERPLQLYDSEANSLTNAVHDYFANAAEDRYNKDKQGNASAFSSLPRGIRTAIVSVWFQFGNPERYKNFWGFFTKNDWGNAVKELRNFYSNPKDQQNGDLRRRNDEADIIEATFLKCNRSIDAVLLLDESGSVPLESFQKSLRFIQRLTEAFPDERLRAADGTRFGLSTFDSTYRTQFYLSNYSSQSGYATAIGRVRKFSGGTNLGYALTTILSDQFTAQRGLRNNTLGIPRVLIVLTDGQSSDSVAVPAKRVRDRNIVTYAIGIAGYSRAQLLLIASSASHVYTLSAFNELETFIGTLTAATCNEPNETPIDNVVKTTVSQNDFQYFRFSVDPKQNLELNIQDIGGVTFVYVSTINPHPYEFDYDLKFESSQKNKILVISPGKVRVQKRSSDTTKPVYLSVTAKTETASFTVKGTYCSPLNCTEGTNEIKGNSGCSLVRDGQPHRVVFVFGFLSMLYGCF